MFFVYFFKKTFASKWLFFVVVVFVWRNSVVVMKFVFGFFHPSQTKSFIELILWKLPVINGIPQKKRVENQFPNKRLKILYLESCIRNTKHEFSTKKMLMLFSLSKSRFLYIKRKIENWKKLASHPIKQMIINGKHTYIKQTGSMREINVVEKIDKPKKMFCPEREN